MGIDPEHNLSFYFGHHVLNSPVHSIRANLYRLIFDELTGETTADPFTPVDPKGLTY